MPLFVLEPLDDTVDETAGVIAGGKLLSVPWQSNVVRPATDSTHEFGSAGLDTSDDEILTFVTQRSAPRHW